MEAALASGKTKSIGVSNVRLSLSLLFSSLSLYYNNSLVTMQKNNSTASGISSNSSPAPP